MSFDTTIVTAGKKQPQPATRSSSTAPPRPQEPPLLCPRCDSPNTKFCYYNNYNLSQPRYFCKTCRRYWTKGGALRNVPIGGGCRKNKKTMKYSLKLPGSGGAREYSKDSSTGSASSDFGGGLKSFFQGLSTAMDFQLACPNTDGLSTQLGNLSNVMVSSTPPCLGLDPLTGFSSGFLEMGSMNFQTSIESLNNSINQDLHWQLQQQRLAMLGLTEKPQPNLFMNLDNPKKPESCPIVTSTGNMLERFLDKSYAIAAPTLATTSSSNWSGIQSWPAELAQFNSLPN